MDEIRFNEVQLEKSVNVYDNSRITVADRFSELEKNIEDYKHENTINWNRYYINKEETDNKLVELDEQIKRNKNSINLKTDSIWGHISVTVPYLRKDVDKLKKELNVTYKIIGIIVVLDLILDILRLL